MQVKQQQIEAYMKQLTGSKLEKEYDKAVYCHPAYLYAECSMQNAGLDESQAGIKTAGRNINSLRNADENQSNGQKQRGTKEPFNEGERGE